MDYSLILLLFYIFNTILAFIVLKIMEHIINYKIGYINLYSEKRLEFKPFREGHYKRKTFLTVLFLSYITFGDTVPWHIDFNSIDYEPMNLLIGYMITSFLISTFTLPLVLVIVKFVIVLNYRLGLLLKLLII